MPAGRATLQPSAPNDQPPFSLLLCAPPLPLKPTRRRGPNKPLAPTNAGREAKRSSQLSPSCLISAVTFRGGVGGRAGQTGSCGLPDCLAPCLPSPAPPLCLSTRDTLAFSLFLLFVPSPGVCWALRARNTQYARTRTPGAGPTAVRGPTADAPLSTCPVISPARASSCCRDLSPLVFATSPPHRDTPPPSIRPLRIAHTAQRFWCAADPVSAPPALLLLLPLLRLYYTQHRHNYSYTPAFLTTAPCPPLFPTHRPTRPRRPCGAPRSSSASPPRSRRAAADGRSALVCTSRPTANAARPPARRAAGPLRRLPAGPRPCVIIPLPSLPLPFWNKKALAQVEPPAFRPFYETAGFALTLIAPRRRRNASPDTRTCETTPQPLRRSSPDGPRPPLSTAIRFSSLRPPPL